jgi:hypothetical protein
MSQAVGEHQNRIPSNYLLNRENHPAQVLTYGFMVDMTRGMEKNTVRCEYSIQNIGKSKLGHQLFLVDRISPVYINDKEPDTLAEELACKIATAIYPLQLETDEQGSFAKINNHSQILERWYTLKPELLEYYDGEDMRKYIQLSEQSLSSVELLYEKLSQDWFLISYFAPVLGTYSSNSLKQTYIYLPISDSNVPVQYLTTWHLNPSIDEHDEITVHGEGTVQEDRCKMDFEQDCDFPYYRVSNPAEHDVTGNFEHVVKLQAQGHSVESISCFCSLELDMPISIKVSIYHLGATVATHNFNTIEGPMVVADQWKEKGGFWNKIFRT